MRWHFCLFWTLVASLSNDSLKALREVGDDFDIRHGRLLSPILQPRVPGTPGSAAVRKHFTDFFTDNLPQWHIQEHHFTANVPPENQSTDFVNLIVTRDPPGARPGEVAYLTLVAHYDSLQTPSGFIGAIDSAAPCAMLLHLAQSLEPALQQQWKTTNDLDEQQGLQLIFLDGEEAFVRWTPDDSIYGAKALAAHMETSLHPALSTYRSVIDSIRLFVLLDLLGTAHPSVPSYFPTTHWAYERMHTLAQQLQQVSKTSQDTSKWFSDVPKQEKTWLGGQIGDDHTPFQLRGVEILHLIPLPFPHDIWHTKNDDGEHLDLPTCKDWALLVTAFAADYLDLDLAPLKARHVKTEL